MRKFTPFLCALVGALLLAGFSLNLGHTVWAAGNVNIIDDAKVLSSSDRNAITQAASNAPFDVIVWTNTTAPSAAAFQNDVRTKTGAGQVVVGLDPVHKYNYINTNSSLGFAQGNVDQAVSASNAYYQQGQWGNGLAAAISTLAAAAPSQSSNSSGGINPLPSTAPSTSSGGGFPIWLICLIPIILIGAFMFLRNRGGMQRGGVPPVTGGYPPQAGYGQPGYGQPGYGQPGYGQQQGGINPGAAGLGGAALGGLIGYEIGRNQGNQGQQGDQGGGIFGGSGDQGSGGGFGGGGFGGGDVGSGSVGFGGDQGGFGGGGGGFAPDTASFGGGGGGDVGGGSVGFGGGDTGGGGSFGDSGGGGDIV